MSLGGQHHSSAALLPVSIVQGAGWARGPVWTGEENITHRESIVQPIASQCTDWAIPQGTVTVCNVWR